MKTTIDSPNHLQIIQYTLRWHLPQHATAWVFGSRATGTAKRFSELDLLIDAVIPLSPEILANLANDFEESDLPYKVDIVDSSTISNSFRERIQSSKILLWKKT